MGVKLPTVDGADSVDILFSFLPTVYNYNGLETRPGCFGTCLAEKRREMG